MDRRSSPPPDGQTSWEEVSSASHQEEEEEAPPIQARQRSTRSVSPSHSYSHRGKPYHDGEFQREKIDGRESQQTLHQRQGTSSSSSSFAAGAAASPTETSESLYDDLLRYHQEQLAQDVSSSVHGVNSIVSASTHSSDNNKKPLAVEMPSPPSSIRLASSSSFASSTSSQARPTTPRSSGPSSSSSPTHSSRRPSATKPGPKGTYREPIPRHYFSTRSSRVEDSTSVSPGRRSTRPRPPSLQSTQSRAHPGSLHSPISSSRDGADLRGSLESLSVPSPLNDIEVDAMLAQKLQVQDDDRDKIVHRQNDDVMNGYQPVDYKANFSMDKLKQSALENDETKEGEQIFERFNRQTDVALLDDEELARRLQEEEESPPAFIKEDEELARRLQECEEPLRRPESLEMESQDEQLARKLQQEEEAEERVRAEMRRREAEQAAPFPTEALQLAGDNRGGENSIEEQSRILERIRLEDERKQMEWALQDAQGDRSLMSPEGIARNPPPPQSEYMLPPPRDYSTTPPPREYGEAMSSSRDLGYHRPNRRGFSPPTSTTPRDYPLPTRDYVVPPRNHVAYGNGPPQRGYGIPTSRDSLPPPRDYPSSSRDHHAGTASSIDYAQTPAEFPGAVYSPYPHERDVRARNVPMTTSSTAGWQESQQHALSEHSYRRRQINRPASPPSNRSLPPLSTAGTMDRSLRGERGHSDTLTEHELERRQIVQKGQEETANAIRTGQSHVVLCRGCNARLQAPIQYALVYCPSCGELTRYINCPCNDVKNLLQPTYNDRLCKSRSKYLPSVEDTIPKFRMDIMKLFFGALFVVKFFTFPLRGKSSLSAAFDLGV